MARYDFFIKVQADLDEEDAPARFAQEICRQIEKVYGVRFAELQNWRPEGE